jgi:predicted membrane metal-binding protein
MRFKTDKNSDGLFKSIFLAHLILFLHLLLFAALGILVVFLSGVMQHMLWILLGGMAVVVLSGYLFYRRLRKEGKTLGEILRSPIFEGRSVEVSLLGGMATLKLDKPRDASDNKAIEDIHRSPLQLEDPQSARIRDINALAQLLEKELITPDEFDKAKQQLLGP